MIQSARMRLRDRCFDDVGICKAAHSRDTRRHLPATTSPILLDRSGSRTFCIRVVRRRNPASRVPIAFHCPVMEKGPNPDGRYFPVINASVLIAFTVSGPACCD